MDWGLEDVLVGNNTFGGPMSAGQVEGTFGTFMGGILMDAYVGFLLSATEGRATVIPEPSSAVLVMMGLLAAGASLRKRSPR
jgi:hypothetical protein